MSVGTVANLPEDPALPALHRALDTDVMFPYLAEAVALQPETSTHLTCSAEVLKHKSGRRCTIRYALHNRHEHRAEKDAVIIGKLYCKRGSAKCVFEWMTALSNRRLAGEQLYIPAPLLQIPELGLLLQEYVEGVELRHVLLAEHSNDRAFSLAAQWLANLHMTPPPPGLPMKPLEREVDKINEWCTEVRPYLTVEDAVRLRQAQDGLQRLASRLPIYEPALIHRDFYPANAFWDGERIRVVDFDELSIGDPALDVAHFLAHLQNLACRSQRNANSFHREGAVFLESYLDARSDIDLHLRLCFYKGYTLLKLAAKDARRQQGDWRRRTGVMMGLANEEVALGLQEAA